VSVIAKIGRGLGKRSRSGKTSGALIRHNEIVTHSHHHEPSHERFPHDLVAVSRTRHHMSRGTNPDSQRVSDSGAIRSRLVRRSEGESEFAAPGVAL